MDSIMEQLPKLDVGTLGGLCDSFKVPLTEEERKKKALVVKTILGFLTSDAAVTDGDDGEEGWMER